MTDADTPQVDIPNPEPEPTPPEDPQEPDLATADEVEDAS